MDSENQDPERERYLQQLRALEKSLRERAQQEEQQVRLLRNEVVDAEAELAERERIAVEAERVRSARRALMQELKNGGNNSRKQQTSLNHDDAKMCRLVSILRNINTELLICCTCGRNDVPKRVRTLWTRVGWSPGSLARTL